MSPKTKAKVKNQNNDKDGGLAYTYNYPPPALLPMHLNERTQRGRDRCIMFIACLPSILILVFLADADRKISSIFGGRRGLNCRARTGCGLSWHRVFAPLYVQMVLTPFMAVGKSGAVSLSFLLIAVPLSLFFIAVSHKREFSTVPNPKLITPNFEFDYLAVDTKSVIKRPLRAKQVFTCAIHQHNYVGQNTISKKQCLVKKAFGLNAERQIKISDTLARSGLTLRHGRLHVPLGLTPWRRATGHVSYAAQRS